MPVPCRAVCRRSGACCAALTGLVNSFAASTQGVALGYHLAPRWGFGSRCGGCGSSHAPPGISASEARSAVRAAPAVTPFSRSGAFACLATELCREWSEVVAPWAQPRCEKRSGRASSGRRVRPERDGQSREGAVSAPSRVWPGALTSGEQDASDTADGTMPAAPHAAPPKAASLLRRQRDRNGPPFETGCHATETFKRRDGSAVRAVAKGQRSACCPT